MYFCVTIMRIFYFGLKLNLSILFACGRLFTPFIFWNQGFMLGQALNLNRKVFRNGVKSQTS